MVGVDVDGARGRGRRLVLQTSRPSGTQGKAVKTVKDMTNEKQGISIRNEMRNGGKGSGTREETRFEFTDSRIHLIASTQKKENIICKNKGG